MPALEQRVWRLQRLDRRDRLRAAQLRDVEVRHADVAHEPLGLQLGERRPPLLDVLVGIGPVDLVDVDDVELEPREARLDLAADRVALEAVRDGAVLLVQRRLGEHVRAIVEALQRATHDLLGVAKAVDRGGIDPVDAELDRPPDRRDRLLVVLVAPGVPPPGAPDRPCAASDAADLHSRGAERDGPHSRAFHGCER